MESLYCARQKIVEMSSSPTLPEGAIDSQTLVQELTGVRKNPVDVSEMPVGQLFRDGWESGRQGQNSDFSEHQDSMTDEANNRSSKKRGKQTSNDEEITKIQAAVSKSTNARNRFSFSKRSLFGRSDLFLQDEYRDQWPPSNVPADHVLLGKIQSCPSKRNGNTFYIQWNWFRMVKYHPLGFGSCTQTYLKIGTRYKSAVQAIDKNTMQSTPLSNQRTSPRRASMQTLPTPPSAIHAQRVADLRSTIDSVAAASTSSVSTLTMPSIVNRQSTRSADNLESSSDEEEDFLEERTALCTR